MEGLERGDWISPEINKVEVFMSSTNNHSTQRKL